MKTIDPELKWMEGMLFDDQWLFEALEAIASGFITKAQRGNFTVYKVKNIIRIDIKEV